MKTFNDVPMWGLCTTGPGDVIFVKISESGTPNAVNLTDRKPGWVPSNRGVHILDEDKVLKVQSRWA